jgi:GNAT superfamily N-acetyltransferase
MQIRSTITKDTTMDIQIRLATADDIPLMLDFIHQKAEFDGCPNSVEATPDRLIQTLFGESPLAYVLFTEVDGCPIGFASYFYTYSTFLARPGIWLDDLYIQPAFRGCGVGTALINHLAAIAQAQQCGRIEWTVDIENANGIQFYQKQGAQIKQDVRLCRLDQKAIAHLADKTAVQTSL